MASKRSRVHPNYKTKYRVTNWPDYDREDLVQDVWLRTLPPSCRP